MMGLLDLLANVLSHKGNDEAEESSKDKFEDDEYDVNEDEYPTHEQFLENDDSDQYNTYIELSTNWEEMDEDKWDEKYDSLNDDYKELVDNSIREQTDYDWAHIIVLIVYLC